MPPKPNDFDPDLYTQKVDSAHDKLKKLEGRIKHIEQITDESLILRIFQKDKSLRDEFEKLIWNVICNKALFGFLAVLAAVIIIPVCAKIFHTLMLNIFKIDF